jgi:hypothetical protein
MNHRGYYRGVRATPQAANGQGGFLLSSWNFVPYNGVRRDY